MEDGTPNGQGYNRCGFVEECTRYEREVKSRQEKKLKRDGTALKHNSKYPSFRRASDTVALVCTLVGSLD